jgi:glycogen(starch) synthase
MKVLLIPSSYPPVLGGLQTVAQTLAQSLLARGYEVKVITNKHPRSLAATEVVEGIEVIRWHFLTPKLQFLANGRLNLFLAALFYFPLTLARLLLLLRRERPDVVNLHFVGAPALFVLIARWFLRFRLIVSTHGDDVEGLWLRGYLDRWVFRNLLRRGDAITACSKDLMTRVNNVDGEVSKKSYVIHNGVNTELFKSRACYEHPRPYVFSYGRLISKKGFDMLVTAFAQVAKINPDVDLIVAGVGEAAEELEKLARDLGIRERVHFVGRANAEQVVALLNGCLFLVVPSRVEPFGIVALEGMAAGKAVLATRVGGLPEFLDLSNNKLVEPSSEDLASGIQEWLASPEDVVARGLHNRALAIRYDWKQAVDQYLSLYQLVAADAPPSEPESLFESGAKTKARVA